MHAFIVAGGKGLRLRELTYSQPKGLLKIGPWHMIDLIICHLCNHGVTQVSIAGGYQCELLQQHVAKGNYPVKVDVLNTGAESNTAWRVKCLLENLSPNNKQPILLSWSDALSNLDWSAMLQQHKKSNAIVTLAAVHPPARFGELKIDGQQVNEYLEKPTQLERWVSGGYFVLNRDACNHISQPMQSWENDVLAPLSTHGKLHAFKHSGKWQCMDTLHEHELLNQLHTKNQAFWPTPKA